jgi:hypothetical protein
MILEDVIVLFQQEADETEAAIALMCIEFKIEKYFEGTGIFVGSIDSDKVEELCQIPLIADVADEYDKSLMS